MFTMYQSIKINDRHGFWDLKPGPSGLALPTRRLPPPRAATANILLEFAPKTTASPT